MNLEFRFFYEARKLREAQKRQAGATPAPAVAPPSLADLPGQPTFFQVLQEELETHASEFSPRRMVQRATECCRARAEAIGFHGLA